MVRGHGEGKRDPTLKLKETYSKGKRDLLLMVIAQLPWRDGMEEARYQVTSDTSDFLYVRKVTSDFFYHIHLVYHITI